MIESSCRYNYNYLMITIHSSTQLSNWMCPSFDTIKIYESVQVNTHTSTCVHVYKLHHIS